jgi:RNA polymerase sigma factor (sigma-70 family)
MDDSSLKMIGGMIRRFYWLEQEDLFQVGCEGWWKAEQKWHPGGLAKQSFCYQAAYFAIIDYMRHTSIQPLTIMWLDEYEPAYYEDYLDPFIQEAVDEIFASPNHRAAWKLKYEQDWKLEDIGELLGMSGTRVCQLNAETRNALKSDERIKVLKRVEG